MLFIDANILLYAVNADSPQHDSIRTLLEELCSRREPLALSWGVIYEFFRVATHPRVFPKPLTLHQAHQFVSALLAAGDIHIITETPDHAAELGQALGKLPRLGGNLVHDLHHAVLMREHGVRDILTCDTDFRLFSWIRIRTPEEAADKP